MRHAMLPPFVLAAAALAATAGCQGREPDAAATDGAISATSEAGFAAEPTSMAAGGGAQGFVDQASASDMFEIESSKLAATMAKDGEVKAFARMMIDAHTKSTAELKAAAGKTDGVAVAPKLSAAQQADLAALKGAGDGFDAMYSAKQVAGHEATLALLKSYAADGAGPLKDFAAKTEPVVAKHLAEARKLPG